MSWVFTFLIAVVSAGVGLVAAGFVAYRHVDWHNVSSFEGLAGFFVVGMALVGLVVGFIVGAVASRVVGAESLAENAQGLGAGVGAVLVLAGLAMALSYVTADFPPQIGGKSLMLEIEVRLPEGVTLAAFPAEPSSGPRVALYSGQSFGRQADLRAAEAREEAGRWVVPARMFLGSSRGDRVLVVTPGGDAPGCYIPIPLPGRPTEADMQWSGWHAVEYLGDLSKPTPEQRYEARYRVAPDAGE